MSALGFKADPLACMLHCQHVMMAELFSIHIQYLHMYNHWRVLSLGSNVLLAHSVWPNEPAKKS